MRTDGRKDIDLLLADWVLGRLASEAVPPLAAAALERGCESPTVAVLAGTRRPTRANIEDELPGLLREVGRSRPTESEALKTLVDDCARRIVDGAVDPVAGAAHIWALWSEHVGDADREPALWTDVRAFIGLASECENKGPLVATCAADIVQEARALLRRGGLSIGRLGEMLPLLQVVRLARYIPDAGLAMGTVGTVVDLLRGDGTAYEVEVVDDDGRTVFVGPLLADDLTALTVADEAEARALVEVRIEGKADDQRHPCTPVITRVDRFERGWVVYYGAAEDDVLLAGNAPFIVDEVNGVVVSTGTARPTEHYVDNYLRTGDPHG